MFARVLSSAVHGINGYPVHVEVDFRFGLPSFNIVGLPDTGVRESRERVIASIKNSGFTFPPQRITVNLAPAHLKKEGPAFDFAIAIGVMVAAEILPEKCVQDYAFVGELGLSGELRPVRGILPSALGLVKCGLKGFLVPRENAKEAAMVDCLPVFPIAHLQEAIQFLTNEIKPVPFVIDRAALFNQARNMSVDFSEIKGQRIAKRALEIAAAGGHNVMLMGPPGSGKTLLARRLPTIMPEMTFDEAMEATKIHSVAGTLKPDEFLQVERPFRSPHHQISDAALVGGGSTPHPGEISLAHRGVLFMDEFPEFSRDVLESLRQPLEDHSVSVARVNGTVRYPCDFLLVAAANPCPCGYLGSGLRACICTPGQIQKYKSKLSGPLLDRIDLHVDVPALKIDELTHENVEEEISLVIRARVSMARKQQTIRFQSLSIYENGQMNIRQVKQFCILHPEGKALLRRALKSLGLSARAYDRILRVSRTIADLDGAENIEKHHLAEAIGYRFMDQLQSSLKELQLNS